MVGRCRNLKAGTEDTVRLAWECARPNAIVVSIVGALHQPQLLPLPGAARSLVFKTGGVDGCDCTEYCSLIAAGQMVPAPLASLSNSLDEIDEAYRILRIGWRVIKGGDWVDDEKEG